MNVNAQVLSLLAAAAWLASAHTLFSAEAPATFKVGDVTFQRPPKWDWVQPTSAMRKAELKVNDPKGKAEAIFFDFGSVQGGASKANVDRWLSLFQEPRDKINAKTQEMTIGKGKLTYVQAQGTYLSGMPGGP